jgi:hypothetical protein
MLADRRIGAPADMADPTLGAGENAVACRDAEDSFVGRRTGSVRITLLRPNIATRHFMSK